MKNSKTFLVLAAAGLIGVGAGIALTGSASAETISHRCDADGCWTVSCDNDGGYCRRVWDGDRYSRRHYTASDYSYEHANGRYVGNTWVPYDQYQHRRSWACDSDGDNCRWMYESF